MLEDRNWKGKCEDRDRKGKIPGERWPGVNMAKAFIIHFLGGWSVIFAGVQLIRRLSQLARILNLSSTRQNLQNFNTSEDAT